MYPNFHSPVLLLLLVATEGADKNVNTLVYSMQRPGKVQVSLPFWGYEGLRSGRNNEWDIRILHFTLLAKGICEMGQSSEWTEGSFYD